MHVKGQTGLHTGRTVVSSCYFCVLTTKATLRERLQVVDDAESLSAHSTRNVRVNLIRSFRFFQHSLHDPIQTIDSLAQLCEINKLANYRFILSI